MAIAVPARISASSPVQETGDTNDIPLDSVSSAFQKIDVMYKRQTATGGVGSAVEFAWDLSANKKI